jgi:hypothetical protein
VRAVVLAAALAAAGSAAAQTKPAAKAKATPEQCARYAQQLEANTNAARKGGDGRRMEQLNEQRRRIQSAQFSAGC